MIFNEEVFDISKLENFNDKIISNVLVLKGANDGTQGSGFLLKDFGLVTGFHVTEDKAFYKVYNYNQYEETSICSIAKEFNEIKSDLDIDYAIYDFNNGNEKLLELGNCVGLEIGDTVTIVGYPNFQRENSPNI